jgi:putative selenate reductase FAD-binding subunit
LFFSKHGGFPVITQYHRPTDLSEALALIKKDNIYPLGGGIKLSQFSDDEYEVVDLQALALDTIAKKGKILEIGANTTLQTLLETDDLPDALIKAIKHEATLNTRNSATVAGALMASDGRSPFSTMMMGLDADLTITDENGETSVKLGDFLPLRDEMIAGKLITKISIPLNQNVKYEYVARTPADKPIVCVALSQWPGGRTRLVFGGWGESPSLAMDGKGINGVEEAAKNVAHDATDAWASAEYRQDVAITLAKRCLGI